jgi:RNA polymerase sigma factor (sigma-70 family)
MNGTMTLACYGAEMTKAGLLSVEEERALARAIQAGRRAAITVVPEGDNEAALRVEEAIQAGINARHRLVSSNLGWVVSLAHRAATPLVALDELLQAGVIGLIMAADQFDPDKGRFITYATYLVRQEITRAIEDAGPGPRLRMAVRREAAEVRAAVERLRGMLGRFPTMAEITAATNLSETAIRRVLPVVPVPSSIDDELCSAIEAQADAESWVEETVFEQARAEAVRRLLDTLRPKEARVLRLRFGLDGGREHNRAEVGRALRISRERVRQIEVAALDRLRKEAEGRGLLELVD